MFLLNLWDLLHKKMKRIFLIGFSGAGKTTLGRAFAKRYGIDFIDLDWFIEQRFHKSINQLFEERGEKGFRELEKNMLHEVGEFENVVISCGGGTPCFFDNMDYMLSAGTVVFLEPTEEALFRRLRIARESRPLLRGMNDEELLQAIRKSTSERHKYYSRAHYTIQSDKLENRTEIAGTVEKLASILFDK